VVSVRGGGGSRSLRFDESAQPLGRLERTFRSIHYQQNAASSSPDRGYLTTGGECALQMLAGNPLPAELLWMCHGADTPVWASNSPRFAGSG